MSAGTSGHARRNERCSQTQPSVVDVTPQVFSRSINPNEQVNWVDFGPTTVNLGHHLEKLTDNPKWHPLVNSWSRLGQNPSQTP
jgi:hypothetical protein